MRKLLVTIRTVPENRRAEYDRAWQSLRSAVTGLRANAWRFRHDRDAERYIEFIEWNTGDDPMAGEQARSALGEMQGIAPGSGDLWVGAESTG